MSEKTNNLQLDVKEKPPLLNWILLSLQHVLAMFGGTILVPIVVNTTLGAEVLSIPMALITSGIGTLIYLAVTGYRSPVFLGSSFVFIAPMVASYAVGGIESIFTSLMVVGIVYLIVSIVIRMT